MGKIIWFFGILCLPFAKLEAQINVLGKPGLIMTPSAEWDTLPRAGASFAYIPKEYNINNFMKSKGLYSENIYSLNVPLTDFIRVNLNLTRLPDIPERIGIGDRHLDVSFRVLKEKTHLPAMVIIVTPALGAANFLVQDLIVLTKHIQVGRAGVLALNAGYGMPYFFGRPPNSRSIPLENKVGFHRKAGIGNTYLSGVFGGVKWQPWDFLALMAEYDSQHVHYGALLQWKDVLLLQGHLLGGKVPAFTTGVRLPLDFSPFEMRSYERKK